MLARSKRRGECPRLDREGIVQELLGEERRPQMRENHALRTCLVAITMGRLITETRSAGPPVPIELVLPRSLQLFDFVDALSVGRVNAFVCLYRYDSQRSSARMPRHLGRVPSFEQLSEACPVDLAFVTVRRFHTAWVDSGHPLALRGTDFLTGSLPRGGPIAPDKRWFRVPSAAGWK